MNQYANTQTSLSVQISNSQITLCQGNLILNYSLDPSQNIINLTPVLSACPSQNLTNAMMTSKYFRLHNGILNFYDNTVTLTAGLVYSAVFDPSQPIFGGSAGVGAISTSNLAGTWYILSLFNIPMATSPYTLIFTANTIELTGGCGTYTLNYTINSTTQIITIGSPAPSVASSCSQSDDQLYLSGITNMYKYLISTTNGVSSMSVYDQSGSIGYSLSTTPPSSPSPPSPPRCSYSFTCRPTSSFDPWNISAALARQKRPSKSLGYSDFQYSFIRRLQYDPANFHSGQFDRQSRKYYL